MKKILFAFLILLCTFILIACNESSKDDATTVHTCQFGEWVTIRSSTCTSDGEQKRICSCGNEEKQIITATHTYTADNYCEICLEMKPGTYTEGLVYQETRYIYDGNTVEVIDIGSAINNAEIIIPPYYNGKKVGEIAEKAFINCKSITSISIPNTVTYIGEGAFSGCSSLNKMTIPTIGADNEDLIGGTYTGLLGYYFGKEEYENSIQIYQESECITDSYSRGYSCYTSYIPKSLKTIILIGSTDDEEKIEPYAFNNLHIETVIIKATVKQLGWGLFKDCKQLKNVTFEENGLLTDLRGFEGCTSLTSIQIPNYITELGMDCFSGCTGLNSITIPDSVTTIGSSCFYGCTNLKTVVLPSALTIIEGSSFSIPDDTSSKLGAFSGCSSLTEITLPASLKTIENYAFYGCTNLKTIHNKSRLSITKGSTSNGYVAYYATTITNE